MNLIKDLRSVHLERAVYTPKSVPLTLPMADLDVCLIFGSLGSHKAASKPANNQFVHFCTVHWCTQAHRPHSQPL